MNWSPSPLTIFALQLVERPCGVAEDGAVVEAEP